MKLKDTVARLKQAIKTRENQILKLQGQQKRALRHHRPDIADDCERRIEVLRLGNKVDARVLEEYRELEDKRVQGLVIQTEEDLNLLQKRRHELVATR